VEQRPKAFQSHGKWKSVEVFSPHSLLLQAPVKPSKHPPNRLASQAFSSESLYRCSIGEVLAWEFRQSAASVLEDCEDPSAWVVLWSDYLP
jgi:hypothetical protein